MNIMTLNVVNITLCNVTTSEGNDLFREIVV
jgi:hypothetical protein